MNRLGVLARLRVIMQRLLPQQAPLLAFETLRVELQNKCLRQARARAVLGKLCAIIWRLMAESIYFYW